MKYWKPTGTDLIKIWGVLRGSIIRNNVIAYMNLEHIFPVNAGRNWMISVQVLSDQKVPLVYCSVGGRQCQLWPNCDIAKLETRLRGTLHCKPGWLGSWLSAQWEREYEAAASMTPEAHQEEYHVQADENTDRIRQAACMLNCPITLQEVINTLSTTRDGKAVGIDNVASEILKAPALQFFFTRTIQRFLQTKPYSQFVVQVDVSPNS